MTVYPDDNNKPPAGKELNIPARITLLGVYPIDRATREEITDVERIRAMNYGDYLREVTKKFDGEFVNYGLPEGSWTFMVTLIEERLRSDSIDLSLGKTLHSLRSRWQWRWFCRR